MVNPPLGHLANGNSRLPRKSGIDPRQLIRITTTRAREAGIAAGQVALLRALLLIDQEGNARMADISIVQEHGLSPEMARAAAQKVSERMAAEYGLACRWEGEVLRFERGGLQGTLTLEAQRAAMRIRLGLLMGAFAPTIEAKVAENMRKVFAPA